jgi:hypothetical protein
VQISRETADGPAAQYRHAAQHGVQPTAARAMMSAAAADANRWGSRRETDVNTTPTILLRPAMEGGWTCRSMTTTRQSC